LSIFKRRFPRPNSPTFFTPEARRAQSYAEGFVIVLKTQFQSYSLFPIFLFLPPTPTHFVQAFEPNPALLNKNNKKKKAFSKTNAKLINFIFFNKSKIMEIKTTPTIAQLSNTNVKGVIAPERFKTSRPKSAITNTIQHMVKINFSGIKN
jgi:hypothetical protein